MSEGDPGAALLERFFSRAREVALGSQSKLELLPDDLDRLIEDDLLIVRFRQRFKLDVQEPDHRTLIVLFLQGLGNREEELAQRNRDLADAIEKSVGRLGIGAAGGGIAAIAASAGWGALAMLGGGLVAMGVSAVRVYKARERARRHEGRAKRMKMVLKEVEQ